MVRTKILDQNDLKRSDFVKANNFFNAHFGNDWPEVPLRRWEYCAAAVFSGVMEKPGVAIDVGCGDSIFPQFLKAVGCEEVYAIDPRIRLNENKNGVCYRQMSMTNISGFDEFFDYVFAISSIEHINAGKFKLEGMEFDTGDTKAMLELCRILKPGGVLILTTDYANKYYPPPGLWPCGSHRVYDWFSINERLIYPAKKKCGMKYYEGVALGIDNVPHIKNMEPKGYNYTEIILTFVKGSKESSNGNKM